MKYEIEKEKLEDAMAEIDRLEGLLTDMISDLHNVKGGMQARHTFMYYRDLAWRVKYILRDDVKPKTK